MKTGRQFVYDIRKRPCLTAKDAAPAAPRKRHVPKPSENTRGRVEAPAGQAGTFGATRLGKRPIARRVACKSRGEAVCAVPRRRH